MLIIDRYSRWIESFADECFFPRRLNTTWYQCMKTVNNLQVYDPHSPELKRLLNHLQNAEIIEASRC